MKFYTRKLIKPGDLNAHDTLFGGRLLEWIDEAAGIYAMTKLNSRAVVTKFISEINFVSSAKQADVIEIGMSFIDVGTSSITFKCEVRNLFTKKTIITIDKIVFVNVGADEQPKPHNITRNQIIQTSTPIS